MPSYEGLLILIRLCRRPAAETAAADNIATACLPYCPSPYASPCTGSTSDPVTFLTVAGKRASCLLAQVDLPAVAFFTVDGNGALLCDGNRGGMQPANRSMCSGRMEGPWTRGRSFRVITPVATQGHASASNNLCTSTLVPLRRRVCAAEWPRAPMDVLE